MITLAVIILAVLVLLAMAAGIILVFGLPIIDILVAILVIIGIVKLIKWLIKLFKKEDTE